MKASSISFRHKSPRFPLLSALCGLFCICADSALATEITGAGGTFPASVYKQWAQSFKLQVGVSVNYKAVGSGEGVKQIQAKSVNFGASDKPLNPEELEKSGLMQFPTLVGGVVPVYNVPGVDSGALKLDGKVLAEIYLGKITKWNDAAIAALNPAIQLPDANIEVIYRSDNSGTTFIFTNYLSKVSPEWKGNMGEGTQVAWKVGTGCKSNLLMPICLNRTPNSIGYMDYSYAAKNNMPMVQIKNRAGLFVLPSASAFQSAATHAKWIPSSGFNEILTDEPGGASWPITGATFVLMHKVQENADTAQWVLNFFDWAYRAGGNMASDLGYVPLPTEVQQSVRNAWVAQVSDTTGKIICQASCSGAVTTALK